MSGWMIYCQRPGSMYKQEFLGKVFSTREEAEAALPYAQKIQPWLAFFVEEVPRREA